MDLSPVFLTKLKIHLDLCNVIPDSLSSGHILLPWDLPGKRVASSSPSISNLEGQLPEEEGMYVEETNNKCHLSK